MTIATLVVIIRSVEEKKRKEEEKKKNRKEKKKNKNKEKKETCPLFEDQICCGGPIEEQESFCNKE